MIPAVLLACGALLATHGSWRGCRAARAALGPLMHEGEPTRTALEAVQPLRARPRVRFVVGRVAAAVGWLVLAMYGLFLAAWSGAAA